MPWVYFADMRWRIAGVVGCCVALAACSSSNASSERAVDELTSCDTMTSSSSGARTDRATWPMELCAKAGVNDPDLGKTTLTFTVTDIEVDPTCPLGIAEDPVNGHFVALTMQAETTPEFRSSVIPYGFSNGSDWSAVGSDGFRTQRILTSEAGMCVGLDWPTLDPGSKYLFRVVLDVKSDSGVVIFAPTDFSGQWSTDPAWEWEY